MSETKRQKNQEFKALVEQIQSQHMPITEEEWNRAKRLDEPEWTEEETQVATERRKKAEEWNSRQTDEISW